MIYWFNLLGLIAGFIGAAIMFYGTPKVLSGTFHGGHNKERDKKGNRIIRIGMVLLTLGFLFQLIAMILTKVLSNALQC